MRIVGFSGVLRNHTSLIGRRNSSKEPQASNTASKVEPVLNDDIALVCDAGEGDVVSVDLVL